MENTKYVWPDNEKLVYVSPPNESYTGNLSDFYSSNCFPELKIIESNWEKIRDEVLEFERKAGEIRGMDSYSPSEVKGGRWGNIILKHYMWKFFWNMKNFPLTTSLIESIPNCSFAAFSVLYPKAHIQPHYGDTNGVIRVHLGLIIPDKYPAIGLKVNDIGKGLQEGKFLCYPDVKKHEAWNYSDHKRYILILDLVPNVLKEKRVEICVRSLGVQSFTFFYKNLMPLRILPQFVHKFLIFCFTLFWRVYLILQFIVEKAIINLKK